MSKAKTNATAAIEWQPVRVKLGDLKPWDHNPRQSTKVQAARILQSFSEFGQVQAVAVGPEFDVYDGHQRLSALLTLHGKGYEIDARRSSVALDDAQRQRLVLMLHAGATGEWNWDLLSAWDSALLQSSGIDAELLSQMNRDAAAIALMLSAADEGGAVEDVEPQVDRAEELREKWGVAPGQLWELGAHRLLCGDSTKAEDVTRVMAGDCAELLFTSPPYADMREYKGDDLSVDKLSQFIPAFKPFARYQVVNLGIKRDGGEVVQYWDTYIAAARNCGYKLLSWNVWSRHGFGGSVGALTAMFPIEHEFIFVFGDEVKAVNGTVPNKHGGKKFSSTNRGQDGQMSSPQRHEGVNSFGRLGSVYVSDVARGEKDHPAMFPVDFPKAYIEAMTKAGNCVAEPFSGSGTTIIACEQLGRKCRAVEISPGYVAVALERYFQATNKTPVLVEP